MSQGREEDTPFVMAMENTLIKGVCLYFINQEWLWDIMSLKWTPWFEWRCGILGSRGQAKPIIQGDKGEHGYHNSHMHKCGIQNLVKFIHLWL